MKKVEENHLDNQPESEELELQSSEQPSDGEVRAEDEVDTPEEQPVEDELSLLQRNLQEQKEKYLRLFADFDNFKKRTARERLELMQTAGKETIIDLLPILDDFERAMKAAEVAADITAVREGMSLIFHKLQNSLQSRGLKAMDSIGKKFDSELHEAVTEIPAPKRNLRGKVVDEIERGYYLNERIIRFAKVIVGK